MRISCSLFPRWYFYLHCITRLPTASRRARMGHRPRRGDRSRVAAVEQRFAWRRHRRTQAFNREAETASWHRGRMLGLQPQTVAKHGVVRCRTADGRALWLPCAPTDGLPVPGDVRPAREPREGEQRARASRTPAVTYYYGELLATVKVLSAVSATARQRSSSSSRLRSAALRNETSLAPS